MQGTSLGLTPPGVPTGPAQLAQEAIANGAARAWNAGAEITTIEGAVSTAAATTTDLAAGILDAKFVYDAATFGGGFAGCVAGWWN